MNRVNNESCYVRETNWFGFIKLEQKESISSGNKLLQWNKVAYDWTGASFTQSTPCVPWIQAGAGFQHLNVTGTEQFNGFFSLSQGFALGNSTNALCSCQWRNPRSLWYGCKSNYRFVTNGVYISSFHFHLFCSWRLFSAVIRRGSRLSDLQ